MHPIFAKSAVRLLAGSALVSVSPAAAQGLEVNPVIVDVAPGQLATSLKVTNHNERAIAYQIRPFSWQQDAQGNDKLTPTNELLSSPPLATIPPGGSQIVRLVLRQPPQGREETYRILFDQLPTPREGGTVHVLVQLSIPVFAEPQVRVAPRIEWRVAEQGGQQWLLASNTGTEHLTLSDLKVFAPDGQLLELKTSSPPHVLAGATRRWLIESRQPPAGRAIRVTANRGRVDERVPLPAGS